MGNLLGQSQGGTAARAAERAAEAQRLQAQRQYEETTRRSQESEAASKALAAEQARRTEAAATLQRNLQALAQDKGNEVAEVVSGGSAEQITDDRKRKRKQPGLSTTLGIDIV